MNHVLNKAFAFTVLGATWGDNQLLWPIWYLHAIEEHDERYPCAVWVSEDGVPAFFEDFEAVRPIIEKQVFTVKYHPETEHKYKIELIRPGGSFGENTFAFGRTLAEAAASALHEQHTKRTKS